MVTPLIPQRTVDSIRALQLRTMPDTAIVYEVTRDPDGEGGTVDTFEPRDPLGSACKFSSPQARDVEYSAVLKVEADVVVKLPAGTVCVDTDRIVVTRAEDGAVFDVEVTHVVEKSVEFATKVYAKDLSP